MTNPIEDRGAYLGALFMARSSMQTDRTTVFRISRDVAELRRAARSLDALAVADCNVGLTDRQEARRERLAEQVAEIASRYSLRAHTSGDPRGAVVRLFSADETEGDGFGGGWPVY